MSLLEFRYPPTATLSDVVALRGAETARIRVDRDGPIEAVNYGLDLNLDTLGPVFVEAYLRVARAACQAEALQLAADLVATNEHIAYQQARLDSLLMALDAAEGF